MSEALLNAMSELDQLRDKAKQLEDSNEWLEERNDRLRVCLLKIAAANILLKDPVKKQAEIERFCEKALSSQELLNSIGWE